MLASALRATALSAEPGCSGRQEASVRCVFSGSLFFCYTLQHFRLCHEVLHYTLLHNNTSMVCCVMSHFTFCCVYVVAVVCNSKGS